MWYILGIEHIYVVHVLGDERDNIHNGMSMAKNIKLHVGISITNSK